MVRVKKESETLNCKISKPIAERLKEHCSDTGLSKTATVERALKRYFDKYEKNGKI